MNFTNLIVFEAIIVILFIAFSNGNHVSSQEKTEIPAQNFSFPRIPHEDAPRLTETLQNLTDQFNDNQTDKTELIRLYDTARKASTETEIILSKLTKKVEETHCMRAEEDREHFLKVHDSFENLVKRLHERIDRKENSRITILIIIVSMSIGVFLVLIGVRCIFVKCGKVLGRIEMGMMEMGDVSPAILGQTCPKTITLPKPETPKEPSEQNAGDQEIIASSCSSCTKAPVQYETVALNNGLVESYV